MPVRVLVTRPEPGAARTAQRLAELGFEPVLLPLTETVALSVDRGLRTKEVAAVAITSANAVRHAPKPLIEVLATLPCHAVGKKTAEAARAAGFLSVSDGPGDAVSLADEIAGPLAGKTIVYLCGRARFPVFEERLNAANVHVQPVETYDTVEVKHPANAIAARLSGRPVEFVLLYSTKAAVAARALAMRPELLDAFEHAMFLCLSGRVAAGLAGIPGERVRISVAPTEQALLALLPAAG